MPAYCFWLDYLLFNLIDSSKRNNSTKHIKKNDNFSPFPIPKRHLLSILVLFFWYLPPSLTFSHLYFLIFFKCYWYYLLTSHYGRWQISSFPKPHLTKIHTSIPPIIPNICIYMVVTQQILFTSETKCIKWTLLLSWTFSTSYNFLISI